MPWSWGDTKYSIHREYSIHRVQHPPKIVCLPSILMIRCWPLNVASASGIPPKTIDRHQPALHESSKGKLHCHIPTVVTEQTDESSLRTRPAVHRQPLSTGAISLCHSPQVHVQSHSITASKCITTVARSGHLCSHDHGLKVHLQTRLITSSKCIPKLALSWSPPAAANTPNYGL